LTEFFLEGFDLLFS